MKELLTELGWTKIGHNKYKKESAIIKVDSHSITVMTYEPKDRQIVDSLFVEILKHRSELKPKPKPSIGERTANAIISFETEQKFNSLCFTGKFLDKQFPQIAWGFVQSFVDYKFNHIDATEWQHRFATFCRYVNQIVKWGIPDLIFRLKVRFSK